MTDSRPVDLLSGLKADLKERELLGRRRERVLADLKGLELGLRGLRKRLAKEGADVARLERMSLLSLLYSIVGNRDERLKKERDEHLAARLEHLAALSEKRGLEKELAAIEAKLRLSTGAEKRHADVLRKLESKDEAARKALELCEQKSHSEGELREINEAIRASNAVAIALDELETSLRTAEAWGIFDIVGGGLLATAAKRSALKQAWSRIVQVRTATRRLRREMEDVQIKEVPRMELWGFLGFADYLYDGLVVDLLVQEKVLRTKKHVRTARAQIVKIEARLKRQRRSLESELKPIRDELERKR